MSNTHDDTLKIPGGEKAEKARERIAALSDAHLQNDHPLLRTHKSTGLEEPKHTATELAAQGKLKSPAKRRQHQHGLPAEIVGNKRKLRPLPSKKRPIVSAIASFLLLMLIFKSEVVITQIKYLTSKGQVVQTKTEPAKTGPVVAAAPLIEIPKINVSAPIVYEPSVAENSIQKALQRGVVHYGNTPEPGQPGNSVIVGHSSNDWWEPGDYKFVFVLLDKLIVGDKFTINHKSKRYVYEVTKKKVVAPTDLSVLNPTEIPSITLITCTPPGTSWRRLIVQAKQVSPSPETVHKAVASNLDSKVSKLPSNAPDFIDQIFGFFKGLLDKLASALS